MYINGKRVWKKKEYEIVIENKNPKEIIIIVKMEKKNYNNN
jgi:hypothetical protein